MAADTFEIRTNDDGTLDEVVGTGAVHLEQMDTDHWWICFGDAGASGGIHVNLTARGKITATVMDERAIVAPRCAQPETWIGPHANAWVALNETRKAVATAFGADPETWPHHGNAPLAIAAVLAVKTSDIDRLRARIAALEDLINAPELVDFMKAVPLEAAHQRNRWGTEHDAGKTNADWFWLIGYLAGKALNACAVNDREKALHHVITTAAAAANWHAAMLGKTNMRPGIAAPDLDAS